MKTTTAISGSSIVPEKISDTKLKKLVMNWNNCSISQREYSFTTNQQPDITNRCSNVFKIGDQTYDMVFHYRAID